MNLMKYRRFSLRSLITILYRGHNKNQGRFPLRMFTVNRINFLYVIFIYKNPSRMSFQRVKNRHGHHLTESLVFHLCRMYWLCLAALTATVAAQGSYDLEPRVSFPGKSSSLGPLYSSGLNAGQGFRDNSYEDNIVTPTPSPTPAYRNPSSQPPVSNKIITYS